MKRVVFVVLVALGACEGGPMERRGGLVICGDGVCSDGEECGCDCGCGEGSRCNLITVECEAETALMAWRFDACPEAGIVDVRLFDVPNARAWPNYMDFYPTGLRIEIACVPEATVCYGAASDGATSIQRIWGVSLDRSRECQDCCEPCRAAEVSVYLACQ